MFKEKYINKTDSELVDIYYSNSYQDEARLVAKIILVERGKEKLILNNQDFKSISLFILINKLKEYKFYVESNSKNESISIIKSNYGFTMAIVSSIIGALCLLLALFFKNSQMEDVSFRWLINYLIYGGFILFALSFERYRNDSKTSIDIDFKKKYVIFKETHKTKQNKVEYLISKETLFLCDDQNKFTSLVLRCNGERIKLIDLKNKEIESTDKLIKSIAGKLNERIKNAC